MNGLKHFLTAALIKDSPPEVAGRCFKDCLSYLANGELPSRLEPYTSEEKGVLLATILFLEEVMGGAASG